MKLEKILVAVDLSEASPKVLEEAFLLAQRFDAVVDVVYVWPPPTYVAPDAVLMVPGWDPASIGEYARGEAEKDLEKVLAQVPYPGLNVRSRVVAGRAPDELIAIAGREGFDVIVLGTHGRSGLAKLILGSVAQEVVSRAPCPVLTVRTLPLPPEKQPKQEMRP